MEPTSVQREECKGLKAGRTLVYMKNRPILLEYSEQIMQAFRGLGKEFGFYSKCARKPKEDFKQRSNAI